MTDKQILINQIIVDLESAKAEKEGAVDPDGKDWPEAHGAHDTESGPEV